jgi:hypothetical protein
MLNDIRSSVSRTNSLDLAQIVSTTLEWLTAVAFVFRARERRPYPQNDCSIRVPPASSFVRDVRRPKTRGQRFH